MRIKILYFLIPLGIATSVFSIVQTATEDHSSCSAPCAVKFPKGTYEDEFSFDWSHGKLYVECTSKRCAENQ